ncbi:hypothetical protein QVD17_16717 [Tagetes erecta]|uniref:Uncharacterized protein n=1 Tax=Tagetes erecta TaxID=13708 RepID=A0AAD8P0T3_TARER|nr:hypothetical protein QVD17_16717 [Tagetes erecta]
MEAGQTKKRRPWLIPYHDKIPNLVHDAFDATDTKWSWKQKGICDEPHRELLCCGTHRPEVSHEVSFELQDAAKDSKMEQKESQMWTVTNQIPKRVPNVDRHQCHFELIDLLAYVIDVGEQFPMQSKLPRDLKMFLFKPD